MKFTSLILLFAFTGFQFADSKTNGSSIPFREMSNNAFKSGEYLKYRIHYGIINAGIAELSVNETTVRNGRPVHHIVGKGRSIGMAEWFFRTRDTYETYLDTDAIIPWEFIRDVDEGGYIIKRHVIFDHNKGKAKDLLKDKEPKDYIVPKNAQDVLSTLYYARCMPIGNIQVGQTFPIEMFLDHEMYSFQLKYLGNETLKTKFGKIKCMKIIPVVQSGRVFEDEEGITLWVSADDNRIPIRLEAELLVGSVKMDLEGYKNNLHPLEFKN